jgi:multidrug resistance efflux pump
MKTLLSSRRTRIILIAVLLAVGASAGGWHLYSQASAAANATLTASGTIEATITTISPQIGGQVADVLVQEGEAVQAGGVLLVLDDQGLRDQRTSVEAGTRAAVAGAQAELDAAEKALQDLRDNAPMATAKAEQALAQARKDLDDAQKRNTWQQTGNRASKDTIDATEARLTLAKDTVDKAQAALNHVKDKDINDPVRAQAEANLQAAREARDTLVRLLNWYKGSPTTIDQALLDANVSVAQAAVDLAQKNYDKVKDGPDPDALRLANDQVALAQAHLESAKAQGVSQLRTIDLQLDKLEIKAPSSGVIMKRNVEPGETIVPGASLFQIGQLGSLEVTVYLPEEQYARVKPGQTAQVHVDAYPDKAFTATVLRIANQAEFTPRNVSTVEGRKDTVYGIRLSIENPDMALKPGMPADVTFTQN